MRKWLCVICLYFPLTIFAQLESSHIKMDDLSVEQLQQAAEAGDPDAQYALGYMYYYGRKVSQNTGQAINWIKRASVQGQEQASRALMALGQNPGPTPVEPTATSTIKSASKIAVSTPTTSVEAKPKSQNQSHLAANFTIQLLSSSSKQKVENYIKQYNLQGKATYTQSKHKGKSHYTLVYGSYKTRAEAQAALTNLPTKLLALKPWIKTLGKKSS